MAYEDSDSDDSDSSLEVLPPQPKNTERKNNGTSSSSSSKLQEPSSSSSHRQTTTMSQLDESSSDEEDDLLLSQGSTFSTFSTSKPSSKKNPPRSRSLLDQSNVTKRAKTSATTSKKLPSKSKSTTLTKEQLQQQKENDKLYKQQQREQLRWERERQKQAEKEEKAQQRAQEKQRKADETIRKKRQAEETAQNNGKYKDQEIVVLMDPSLYSSSELNLLPVLKETEPEKFLVQAYPSALTPAKAVQWIRRDYMDGGAPSALKALEEKRHDRYEHLDRLILVLSPHDFIPLLRRSDHGEDEGYPALEAWLKDLFQRWQAVWRLSSAQNPKVLLLLQNVPEALDRQWVEHRRNKPKNEPSPPTEAELHDAINWLLIHYEVECLNCSSAELVQSTIHKMTRSLSAMKYKKQVTELECIKKIKAGVTADDNDFAVAKDTWLRQLQQIPSVSNAKALNVMERYPTAMSLWIAYQTGDEAENPHLLARILSGGKSQEKRLSERIYKLMTSQNPDEMIF